jgi:hypothetical protein
MTCPNCKVSDLPDYARFCLCCGFPVAPAEPITGGGAAASHPPGGDAGCRSKTPKTPHVPVFVFLALGCLVLLIAIDIFWLAGPWSRYIGLVPLPNDLGQQAVVLHDKLEEYERSADTLKTLVTFMISLSTLYALVLALNAYLGVQDATKRAEQSVESLNKLQQNAKSQHEKDLLDIRREFPLFREMQSRIGHIRAELQLLIPEGGFGEEAFGKISDADKVKIAHYEQTVASFEFFNLEPFSEDASKIYQLLGSFHSHKWVLENAKEKEEEEEKERDKEKEKGKEKGKKKETKANGADKHWARFYLERSNELKKDDVATLNELGYFESKVTKERDRAREHLKKSCCVDSKQQRPRYSLALLEHFAGNAKRESGNTEGAKKHYEEAARLLTTALSMKRWQQENQEERTRRADFFERKIWDMHYNRACARARLAELENAQPNKQSSLREDAIADLKSAFPPDAAPVHRERLARDFKQDTNEGGDLFALLHSSFGETVKQLLERINGA